MSADNIEERLTRIESELTTLKNKEEGLRDLRDLSSKMVVEASRKFLTDPNLKSANVFLDELETASRSVPPRLGFWTITITIVTILSDDQAG